MDAEKWLALFERRVGQCVNLFDNRIGHGETADRNAFAVDHQGTAGSSVDPVVGIGVTQVKRQVILTGRIQAGRGDKIKPFGCFAVALFSFGAQTVKTVGTNRIGFK